MRASALLLKANNFRISVPRLRDARYTQALDRGHTPAAYTILGCKSSNPPKNRVPSIHVIEFDSPSVARFRIFKSDFAQAGGDAPQWHRRCAELQDGRRAAEAGLSASEESPVIVPQ